MGQEDDLQWDLAEATERVEQNPNDPVAWADLAAVYSELEQWDEALVAAERCVALAPNETRYLIQLGVVRRELGDFPGASEALRMTLAIEPFSEQANAEMRRLQELRRRRAQAIEKGEPFDPHVAEDPAKRSLWSAVWTVAAVGLLLLLAFGLVIWMHAGD